LASGCQLRVVGEPTDPQSDSHKYLTGPLQPSTVPWPAHLLTLPAFETLDVPMLAQDLAREGMDEDGVLGRGSLERQEPHASHLLSA